MSADHAGEAVECQHSAFACAAACDDIVACACVQQCSCEDSVLHVCKLSLVVSCIHTIVFDFKAHGFHDLAQGLLNDAVLGRLAVLVDQCDSHIYYSLFKNTVIKVQFYINKYTIALIRTAMDFLYQNMDKAEISSLSPDLHQDDRSEHDHAAQDFPAGHPLSQEQSACDHRKHRFQTHQE